jgi:hypothetical protein
LFAEICVGAGYRCEPSASGVKQWWGNELMAVYSTRYSLAREAIDIWKATAMLRLPRVSLLFASCQHCKKVRSERCRARVYARKRKPK